MRRTSRPAGPASRPWSRVPCAFRIPVSSLGTSLSVSVRFSADSVPPVLRATAETLRILADIVGLVQKSTNRRLDVKDSRRTNMEVSIMIEGQQGLSWPRWQRLVRAAEDLGFDGLYRSDHFVDPSGPYQDALELWVS